MTKQRINPKHQSIFSPIPQWMTRIPVSKLSMGAKVTYARLTLYADDGGIAFPCQETMAQEIGLGVRQLRRYLQELEDYGLIGCIQRGQGRSNEYEFYMVDELEESMFRPDTYDRLDRTHMTGLDRTDMTDPILKEQSKRTHTRTMGAEPTVDEVIAHVATRGWVRPDVDGKRFYEHYAAANWHMANGKKVKNWKQCVITWERNDHNLTKPIQEKPNLDIPSYDPSKAGLFA